MCLHESKIKVIISLIYYHSFLQVFTLVKEEGNVMAGPVPERRITSLYAELFNIIFLNTLYVNKRIIKQMGKLILVYF